ncbi:MAG: tRNA uridine-5-carboxymethylaminomethyl(34) synthesis GTPase MnmE [Solidesulfovibrio sp.]|uniref:tRNA uridine-5-carboxymethylaminomethyl(34) synthesis GTPase MnmE n=1 Tax=Solidesulfovibrio sp. TaxID=2910990 RepID=UPI002B201049|nr:tRNA uridine-5-carboxymethylaminomethyl(34) synthesis GTPase MnmE [Solidesulfovibrio sp.]MEA4855825.1 tRNA uridine-5-carboxymethylaminomethyl(34) synthesis GTPase MnmE [Solidesulfovibrio sp.]
MPTPPGFSGDTIAAVATPPGRGGVGIVRLAGPLAREVGARLFASARPGFAGLKPYRLHHGTIRDPGGRLLDEGMVAFMPGPGSYTGEDTVEFFCHGAPAVLRAVLAACFALGARPAGPGEFTKRAFLNGRLDLSQAAAVAELIAARGEAEADIARTRLSGAVGQAARELGAALDDLRAGICLAVDFPEEEVECLPKAAFATSVAAAIARIDGLLAATRRARPFRQGARAALFGRVNAGKSSLFNALLGADRALVADAPGTTRDYLEEGLDLDGLPVRLTDTAGLRATPDAVEAAGKARGMGLAAVAELGLFVVDGSTPYAPDAEAEALVEKLGPGKVLAVLSKADLPPGVPDPRERLAAMGLAAVAVSARTGFGLAALLTAMRARLTSDAGPPEPGAPAPSEREAASLAAARDELSALVTDIAADVPYDLMGARLETARTLVADITGETTADEVLNAVFERFCIGK